MSHVKTLSTTDTRNPTTVQYLSLPTTQVCQILTISFKNIILSLLTLIAAKMPLKIHLFLPTAALATFAIPSYVLKLKHPNLHLPSSPPKITRCNDGRCKTCKFIAHNTTSYTFHNTGQTRTIHQNLSCSSDNLIHMINCKQCLKTDTTLPSLYIGQTGRTLRERFGEHGRGIQNNTDESVPINFNLPNDVELIPLVKVRNSRGSYHYTMEQHFISTAGTLKNGRNRTSDH